MSRHASRRPETITAGKPIAPAPPAEPGPRSEVAETPPAPASRLERVWILVLWLWAAAFIVLLLSETVLFCVRKLS
jgi:heme/copper-type cytochrome/quinol oxidase subunit 2